MSAIFQMPSEPTPPPLVPSIACGTHRSAPDLANASAPQSKAIRLLAQYMKADAQNNAQAWPVPGA